MKSAKSVIKNYDFFLSILKFVLKHDGNPKFKDLYLVDNFTSLLARLKEKLNESFTQRFSRRLDFNSVNSETLSNSIFKKEVDEYESYIDNKAKKELVAHFHLILNLTDLALDLQYEDISFFNGIDLIDTELKNLKRNLKPLTKFL